MKHTNFLATWAILLVTTLVMTEADLTRQRSSTGCKECQKPTTCKSEVHINEIEVPKDVNIPTVEAREKIVYKKVPIPEYEIREKVTTKLIQVPSRKITFRKNYEDQPPTKMKVRKPLIKYNITTVDVEVERLVVHEKPVLKDVPVEQVQYVPVVTDNYEPIVVQKKRPLGSPRPEPKSVTLPKGIRRVTKNVLKEVRVPEITYRYCDEVKNIYVPDKCPGSATITEIDSTGLTTPSTTTTTTSTTSTTTPPPITEPSGLYDFSKSRNSPSVVRVDLRLPSDDYDGSRFGRQADPQTQSEDDGGDDSSLFSAARFARAIGAFLSSPTFQAES